MRGDKGIMSNAAEFRLSEGFDSGESEASALKSTPGGVFALQLEAWRARTERALAARLPDACKVPARLHQAMRYSVLGGGKRVRPMLLFATARTLDLEEQEVEAAACAVELVHAYSLVHDDLPAMDDDDLRRGRPTCHRAYDEATAVLVGDALQPLAFQLLAEDPSLPAAPGIRLRMIALLAEAIGTGGMAGGQALDLAAQGHQLQIADVDEMYTRKTGALIRASVLLAAACVPSLDAVSYASLADFATSLGMAFQIQDDLLDVLGDTAVLGKRTGADSKHGKATYPAIIGVEASQVRFGELHGQALDALARLGPRAQPLRSLAGWLFARRW
jgi:geranylgeranyl pyrophosphate synthase